MNKRQAKSWACFHAALLIQSELSNGWELLDRRGADRPKVEQAMNELIAELNRRGGVE